MGGRSARRIALDMAYAPAEECPTQPQPGVIGAVKETYDEFSKDDVMTHAAALAFYTGLSLAPLLTISVWIARTVFGSESKEKIVQAFSEVIGKTAAEPIRQLLDPASQSADTGMNIAGMISLGIVAFAATTVFAELQAALNAIWSIKAKASGNGIWLYVRKRLLSFGMLLTILFLLLVSMVISTVIQGFLTTVGSSEGIVAMIVNLVVSVLLFTLLFAMLFRYVPDAKLGWNAVWVGAAISSVLFMVGKFGLGLYLGRGSYENSYGAAVGSFVALLVWVYYSSTILLVGAEVTQVYARRHGLRVKPEEHAVRVVQREETVTG